MQSIASVINAALQQVAAILGPLSPFTKAVVPAALALAQLAVTTIVTGKVEQVSLTAAITGVVIAVLVYALPNLIRKATPVVPPVK